MEGSAAQDDVMRGVWWDIFHDSQLSALEERVDISNQNVIAAEARFQQTRALVREARASYFPTVTAGLGATQSRTPYVTSGTPTSARTSAAIHCRLISPGN
jgi:outer membrane protein TolC